MGRIILYGIFGFLIFGGIGIAIGGESVSGTFVLITAIAGMIISILFARWMNSRGEQKLERFSNRPKMIYGIGGAVVGGLIGLQIASYINPSNNLVVLDLLGIGISIVSGAWLALYIARKFDLTNKQNGSAVQTKSQLIVSLLIAFIVFALLVGHTLGYFGL